MDSDVESFKSTQTSVMRVTEGSARFGTKRYDEGMAVDGRADGIFVRDGAGVGAGWPRAVGEAVSTDGATVGAGVRGWT